MRTVKSVLIVTRMRYGEGVFTSFRALANSQGATRINIEGESDLKDIYLLRREVQNISKNHEKDRKIRSIQV